MTDDKSVFLSIQHRTLKVFNLSEKVTKDLLYELFSQCGPVQNVFLRPEFAYVEFEHKVSVGYALALMDGIQLFGTTLKLQPRITDDPETYSYLNQMRQFEATFSRNPLNWWHQFGDKQAPLPPYVCSQALTTLPSSYHESERSFHSRNEASNQSHSRNSYPCEDFNYSNAQFSNYNVSSPVNHRYHHNDRGRPISQGNYMHELYSRRSEPSYYSLRIDSNERYSVQDSRSDYNYKHDSSDKYNQHSHHKSRHSYDHYDNRTFSHDRPYSRY